MRVSRIVDRWLIGEIAPWLVRVPLFGWVGAFVVAILGNVLPEDWLIQNETVLRIVVSPIVLAMLTTFLLLPLMWWYWVRLDHSRSARKARWFVALLVFNFLGALLYLLVVYRTQVRELRIPTAESPTREAKKRGLREPLLWVVPLYLVGWFVYSLRGGQTEWYLGNSASTGFLVYLMMSLAAIGYVVFRLFRAGMRTARQTTLEPLT